MRLMTVDQVADLLALSAGQVRRLIAAGRLEAVNVGTNERNHWRVSEKAVDALCGMKAESKENQPLK